MTCFLAALFGLLSLASLDVPSVWSLPCVAGGVRLAVRLKTLFAEEGGDRTRTHTTRRAVAVAIAVGRALRGVAGVQAWTWLAMRSSGSWL